MTLAFPAVPLYNRGIKRQRYSMFSFLLAVIYLAFVSLGLPDSLLGSAWPVLRGELGVPLSWSGGVFMIIAVGTILSSLLSDRLTRRFGTEKVTAVSVAMTCAALFGFSFSRSYALLCLWAVPYGLGAGGVDAALNNYVALHYASRHMSWLHCMWGVGAAAGPYIMGAALTGGLGWTAGYRIVGAIQLALTVLLFLSLPLWKSAPGTASDEAKSPPIPLKDAAALPGATAVLLCFFCYCAVEQTVGLWASSYLAAARGVDAAAAAGYGSLFFLGITVGRAISGFVTMKLSDTQMVRLGCSVIALGLVPLLLPLGNAAALAGLVLVGLGCAPVYPCLIHATPAHFGADRSQAIIGMQMASAYVGTLVMPPLFGWLAARASIRLFPVYLLVLLVLMTGCHELLHKQAAPSEP